MLPPPSEEVFPLANLTFDLLTQRVDTNISGISTALRHRRFVVDEAYSCEKIGSFPSRITSLSPLFVSPMISLGGAPQLTAPALHLKKEDEFLTSWSLEMPIISEGSVDLIVYWFTMFLFEKDIDDDNNNSESSLSIDTAPNSISLNESRHCGWDQAFYFMGGKHKEYSAGRDNGNWFLHVNAGDTIRYDGQVVDDKFEFVVSKFKTISDNKEDSEPINDIHYSETCRDISLGEMDIALLNDYNRTETYLSNILEVLGNHHDSKVKILELSCNTLSFISKLCLMKNLAAFPANSSSKKWPTHISSHEVVILGSGDMSFISDTISHCDSTKFIATCNSENNSEVAAANACVKSETFVLSGNVLDNYTRCNNIEFDKASSGDENSIIKGVFETWDILISDLVEGGGMIKQNALLDIRNALFLNKRRSEAAELVLFPHSIGAVISLLEYGSLVSHHRVFPEATGGVLVCIERN